MTKNTSLQIVLALFLSLASCSKQQTVEKGIITVSPQTIEFPSDGGNIEITVSSSVTWTVQKSSPCDWIELDRKSGLAEKNSRFYVRAVGKNTSKEAREVNLFFVPDDGVTDVACVKVRQEAPKIVEEFSAAVSSQGTYVDPSVFSSLGATRWAEVKSNVAWTASVAPESTATGIQIPVQQGSGNMDSFEVKVAGINKDFANRKTVVIRFTTESGATHDLTLYQEKGSILALELRKPDNSTSVWPFDQTAPTTAGNCSGEPSFFTIGGDTGYRFGYRASTDCMFEANWGWRVGKGIDNYVEFPAIAGRKLVRVSVVDGNGYAEPGIKDTAGNYVSGGAISESSAVKAGTTYTASKDKLVTWTLSGTEAGAMYRLQSSRDATMRLRHIELEYE